MKKLVMTAFFGALLSTSAFGAVLRFNCGGSVSCDVKTGTCSVEGVGSGTTNGHECRIVTSTDGSNNQSIEALTERIKVLEEMLGVESPISNIENSDSELREEQRFDDGGFAEGEVLFLR